MGTVTIPPVAYGIDDSAGRLVVVRAVRKRKGPVFTVVHDQETSPEQARAAPALHAMIADVTVGGAVTAAAVPAASGLARWLETPFTSQGKALRVLPSLLDLQLPFPVEQCRYQFAGFRRDPAGNVQALAVAVRSADLDRRLEALDACGLDPLTLDHEGLALWAESRRVAAPPRIVAWLGTDRCTLVIGDGDAFASAHGLRFGANDLTDDAGLDQWAARVQHVLRSQLGAVDDRASWLWAGPGAEDVGLRQRLEQALPDIVATAVAPALTTFLATGLARRALAGESAACNLRTGPQAHSQIDRRERSRVVRTSVAASLVGLLLAGAGLVARSVFDARDRAAQQEVTELAMELTGLPASAIARGNEVFLARQHVADDRDATDPFSRALGPGPSQTLNAGIQTAHQLRIRVASCAARNHTFTFRGVAPALAACENYARLLEGQGMAVELEPGAANADGTVAFVLKGRWGDG